MNLSELNNKLDRFHLINHPFYIAWEKGELTQEILQDYAEQYYHCLLYTSPSPRDQRGSRMPSCA